MARKTPPATGPAAYHACLERERVEALQARVVELEARLNGWSSPYALSAAVKDAATRGYQAGHKDGYRSGFIDGKSGLIVAPV